MLLGPHMGDCFEASKTRAAVRTSISSSIFCRGYGGVFGQSGCVYEKRWDLRTEPTQRSSSLIRVIEWCAAKYTRHQRWIMHPHLQGVVVLAFDTTTKRRKTMMSICSNLFHYLFLFSYEPCKEKAGRSQRMVIGGWWGGRGDNSWLSFFFRCWGYCWYVSLFLSSSLVIVSQSSELLTHGCSSM